MNQSDKICMYHPMLCSAKKHDISVGRQSFTISVQQPLRQNAIIDQALLCLFLDI